MTILQILRYYKNKDTSSISYKRFNASPYDLYPAFSICFQDDMGGIYDSQYLNNTARITRLDYTNMLAGTYGPGANIYNSELNGLGIKTLSGLDLQNSTMNFQDTFRQFFAYNEKVHKSFAKESMPFYISYQDPTKVCFTRRTEYKKGLIRKTDLLWLEKFEVLKVLSFRTKLTIYIHHHGQLIRSFNKAALDVSLNKRSLNKLNQYIKISLVHVSVLRKRHNANEPCNPDLHDDDEKLRTQIMDKVGCVPPYWKHFQTKPMTLKDCNSSLQLQKMYGLIKHYKRVMDTYDPPCEEMNIVYTVQREGAPLYPAILFTYIGDMYEEIINEKVFGFEMFWSSIGGIIGIFLGYSLSQIPKLISTSMKRAEDNSILNRIQFCETILTMKCLVTLLKCRNRVFATAYISEEGEQEPMQI